MKKALRPQKDEPIHAWITRIAEELHLDKETEEIMREVAKESYIHGSRDAQEVLMKHLHR